MSLLSQGGDGLTINSPIIGIYFFDNHNSGFGVFPQYVGQQVGYPLNQVLFLLRGSALAGDFNVYKRHYCIPPEIGIQSFSIWVFATALTIPSETCYKN